MLLNHKQRRFLAVKGRSMLTLLQWLVRVMADAEHDKVGCLTFLAPPLIFACAFSASLRIVVS